LRGYPVTKASGYFFNQPVQTQTPQVVCDFALAVVFRDDARKLAEVLPKVPTAKAVDSKDK
jgi:hypothetical protein